MSVLVDELPATNMDSGKSISGNMCENGILNFIGIA